MDWIDELAEIPQCKAWADAEQAYCDFMVRYSEREVLTMDDATFEEWKAEYQRLYTAFFDAQMAFYSTARG